MSIMTAIHFSQYLNSLGYHTPSDCVEIRFICTNDLCRLSFKILGIGAEVATWESVDFSEEVASKVRTGLSKMYSDCYSCYLTARVGEIATVEVCKYAEEDSLGFLKHISTV